MNYLITGGTGLIGSKLIAELQKDNSNNIRVYTRDSEKAASIMSGVDFTTTLTPKVIEESDIVINLAGEPIADKRWTLNQKDRICQSRWVITEQLVNLINNATNPPSVFISGSAIGVYGRQGSTPIDEEFKAYHSEFSNTVCERWEAIAETVNTEHTRLALLRTGIVLDKSAGALAKMIPPFKLGLGGKISSGEQMMSWIHVDDMVNAIMHTINHEQLVGAINMTAPTPVTNDEFSKVLAKTLSRPSVLTTPTFMLRLLFGEMADLLIYGQAVIPAKLLSSGFTFKYNQLDSALNNLLKS